MIELSKPREWLQPPPPHHHYSHPGIPSQSLQAWRVPGGEWRTLAWVSGARGKKWNQRPFFVIFFHKKIQND